MCSLEGFDFDSGRPARASNASRVFLQRELQGDYRDGAEA
jgi:hypothetical protein